jgi:hypothetical protein
VKSIRLKLGILITIIISALGTQAHAQFTFTTNSGAITITKYTGPGGNVIIPSMTNGLPVVTIGANAFWQCFTLLNVTIPDSVTNIGNLAFDHCIAMTNVTLPQSLKTIPGSAFSYCEALPSISIPDSVTQIGSSAFDSCFNLTTVTISSNVTNILQGAFVSCLKLPAITVDALNPRYASVDGVLFDKSVSTLVQCPGGKVGSYSIPPSVYRILSSAFWNCTVLTSVTIPDSVTNIARQAFGGCIRLAAITIPSSVTAIGDGAFGGCDTMTDITVDPLNPSYCSVRGVLFDKGTNFLIQCPGGKSGTYDIPNGVTNIGSYAFSRCFGLTAITIPSSLNSIAYGAFYVCKNLTTLTFPGPVHSIDGAAFGFCTSLQGVYFMGDAPTADALAFTSASPTVYYLPGTAGWGSTLAGRPTALRLLPNPLILGNNAFFGAQSNGFGFTISWATNTSVVVEACTNVVNPVWEALQTNALINGASYFNDPQWTNYDSRFYRLRSP